MKAHVATEGEACEPTVIKGLSEDDWEMLHDLGVSMTEMSIVSEMSLETAVFALQQIELHLDSLTTDQAARQPTYYVGELVGAPEPAPMGEMVSIISEDDGGVIGYARSSASGKKIVKALKASEAGVSTEAVMGAVSRVRILVISTLVSLGVLGDLPTDEDGKPAPVELPSLGFADQHDTLRRLTAERKSPGD